MRVRVLDRFWGRSRVPFGSLLGSLWGPLGILWAPFGALWSPLGSLGVPLGALVGPLHGFSSLYTFLDVFSRVLDVFRCF